jgi:crossover junction endodeoxyribonuclease RuvC
LIRSNTKADVPTRLKQIYDGITEVVKRHTLEEAAIESIFRHKSSESALRLGQARGVALLALAQANLPVSEYNPMAVKKSIGGTGRAGKNEMGVIVTKLLGLQEALSADAADAAAIAMTHLLHSGFQKRLRKT